LPILDKEKLLLSLIVGLSAVFVTSYILEKC